jgi:O-antigen ligase
MILAAMLLSMLLTGIDGLFQAVTGWDFIRRRGMLDGIQASFANHNGFGAWLVVMIPIILGIIGAYKKQSSKKITKSMLWVMAGMLTLCLALTLSRGALTGLIFAMMFFLMTKNGKIFLIAVAFALAISVLGIVHLVNIYPDMGNFFQEFTKIRSWHNVQSTIKDFINFIRWHIAPVMNIRDSTRIGICWEALLIIKKFPVLGCGLNTYAAVAAHYPGVIFGTYPHNSYLQMTAETGIVGLVSFLLLIFALFKNSLVSIGKISDVYYKSILTGFSAGLFGFLVHSFFDVHFYALQLAILMWFMMGLVVAVQDTALKEKDA